MNGNLSGRGKSFPNGVKVLEVWWISMCSEKGESRAGVQDALTGVEGQLMILIQTFTNGSHTVYWAHSPTDFWMFLIYRKQIAKNSVHICTLCSKFPFSWEGTQRRPRMALIFTFPHLDSTSKGGTPGSFSSSASTVWKSKVGFCCLALLLEVNSWVDRSASELPQSLHPGGPGGNRDRTGWLHPEGDSKGRWKCPPGRD